MTETERAWTSYIILGDYEYVSLQEAEARTALVGKLAEALKVEYGAQHAEHHMSGEYADQFMRCDMGSCKGNAALIAEAEKEAGK